MNCGLCERHLAEGQLCVNCAMNTVERLAALPGLFAQLAEFVQPVRRPGARGARPVHPQAPIDLDVVDSRTEFAAVLASWHSALFAALGWDPPKPVAHAAERVQAAVEALRVNVLWIASSWEAAGDFAGEIRDLHRNAVSVTGPRDRSRRLGYCATAVGGVLCGAVVRLPPAASSATCAWCGTVWGPERWMELRAAQAAFSSSASPAEPEARPSRQSASAGTG